MPSHFQSNNFHHFIIFCHQKSLFFHHFSPTWVILGDLPMVVLCGIIGRSSFLPSSVVKNETKQRAATSLIWLIDVTNLINSQTQSYTRDDKPDPMWLTYMQCSFLKLVLYVEKCYATSSNPRCLSRNLWKIKFSINWQKCSLFKPVNHPSQKLWICILLGRQYLQKTMTFNNFWETMQDFAHDT